MIVAQGFQPWELKSRDSSRSPTGLSPGGRTGKRGEKGITLVPTDESVGYCQLSLTGQTPYMLKFKLVSSDKNVSLLIFMDILYASYFLLT
jgi:hypothetical protein